jgi:hypothetical protein
MEQKQHGMQQQQYQGPDRRQSQSQYQGDERRKPDPLFDEPTLTPATAANPGMATQERKDEQEERIRQQQERHDDVH